MTEDVGRLRNGVWAPVVLLWALVLAMPAVLHAQPSSNVLFLIVDDLRPELPSYGHTQIHAPSMERLAEQGLVMHNAYANVPVCGQSRESLLTGRRPFPMGFASLHARTDADTPPAIPLFGALQAQGYRTYSLGKVGQSSQDMTGYWSEAPWHPMRDVQARRRLGNRDYQLPENARAVEEGGLGPAFEAADVPDDAYFNGQIAARAVRTTFDVATRSPLIVKAPGLPAGHTQALVEFLDIYPTLMELLELDATTDLHGESFARLFTDPEAPGKSAVFTGWMNAEAIKTPQFALTEWFNEQGEVSARMLFDHRTDRDETVNLADEPAWRDTVESMHGELMQNLQAREVIRVVSPPPIN